MSIRIISNDHWDTLLDLFEQVDSTINIISPFITNKPTQLLSDILSKNPNVKCNIITRYYRDDFIKGVSQISALQALITAGANIYALKNLHTKLYLLDDQYALIGSANFTSGGFASNLELSLLLENENNIFAELDKYFRDLLSQIIASGDYLLTAQQLEDEQVLVTKLRKSQRDPKIKYSNEHRFGASIKSRPPALPNDSPDTIQAILDSQPKAVINEGIWLKFEGDAKDRYDGNNLYLPTYVDEISSYATFFPANRKPTGIKQNAFIYIAVLTTDNSGRNTPVIIARARTNGYEEGNIATDYMIAQNQWMSIWPNYVRLHNIESLNCNCADGISLMDMLAEVGTSSYPGSKGTSKSLAELSTIHYQKDKLRITEDCMEYLDKRFNELAKKYGVTKYGEESKNTPTFSGRRTITSYMIEIAYRISKDVYKGVISRTKGQRNIAEQSGMNYGSAGDCITNFLAMMNGEKYTRTLNEQHTKYYLENIKYDFGNDALQRAIDACRKHVEYYATLNNGNLNYVERLIEEFETN